MSNLKGEVWLLADPQILRRDASYYRAHKVGRKSINYLDRSLHIRFRVLGSALGKIGFFGRDNVLEGSYDAK